MSGVALRHRPWFGELSTAITTELARDDELAELPVWTMGSINTELPMIAPSVTGILREPERAWRAEEFREPETGGVPVAGGAARRGRPGLVRTGTTAGSPGAREGGDDPYSADT